MEHISGISGKEIELLQKFENIELDILAITETKKKGSQNINLDGVECSKSWRN